MEVHRLTVAPPTHPIRGPNSGLLGQTPGTVRRPNDSTAHAPGAARRHRHRFADDFTMAFLGGCGPREVCMSLRDELRASRKKIARGRQVRLTRAAGASVSRARRPLPKPLRIHCKEFLRWIKKLQTKTWGCWHRACAGDPRGQLAQVISEPPVEVAQRAVPAHAPGDGGEQTEGGPASEQVVERRASCLLGGHRLLLPWESWRFGFVCLIRSSP